MISRTRALSRSGTNPPPKRILKTMRLPLLLLLAVLCLSCGQKTPNSEQLAKEFDQFTGDFIYQSLAPPPVSATANGYHEHMGARLDEMLDDYSPEGLDSSHK